PTASHYLKMLMDSVFGPTNFQNEIVWRYRRWTGGARRFLKMHDTLLFYSKASGRHTFNRLYTSYTAKSLARKKNYFTRIKGDDVYVTSVNPEGVAENDVWEIQLLNSQALERLGYPTQKPEALLERLILASSNEGDVVLDPFCGCGSAVAVAQRLSRGWIGIDITHLAVGLIRRRLIDTFGDDITKTFRVVGEPTDLEGARELAATDPYQFQFWILGLVGARPAVERKGADKGIDGRIYFHDETGAGAKTKQIVISVKAGKLHATYVRDLRGVMEREGSEFGILLSMEEPTGKMRAEAASAGFYTVPLTGEKYSRLQIITVEELLAGRGIDYPGRIGSTFKRAPKAKAKPVETTSLFAAEEPAEYETED
ncbi:MAG: DNA methyltransferase, partial [Actinomycetota bacterium]